MRLVGLFGGWTLGLASAKSLNYNKVLNKSLKLLGLKVLSCYLQPKQFVQNYDFLVTFKTLEKGQTNFW